MILAAPLVIPFAKAVGLSVGALGMAALADQVNEYIQANPEESMKILSTIVPGIGIGQIFMNKEKISLEDLEEMTDEEAQDLSKEEKAELMKQAGKSGGPNKRQTMIDISEKLGLSGSGKEKQDIEYDIDERYDEGGVEEVSKPKFDYKKFFRNRRADGGAIGIEVLFEEKKPRKNFQEGGYEPLFTEDVETFTAPIGLNTTTVPSRINKAYIDATDEAFRIGNVANRTGLTNPETIMKISEMPMAIRTLSDINMMDRKDISNPYSKFEKQGLSSDYRHTLGTSAFKDSIIDYLGSNLGIDKQSGILDTIGSLAAKGATVFEEGKDALSQLKSYQNIDPYSGIQDYGVIPSGLKLSEILAQPIEDYEANFFAADQIPFGTSPLKKMEMIQAYRKFGMDNYMQQLENQKKAAMQEQIRKAEAEAARKKQITQQLQTAAESGGGYQPTTIAQNVARTSSRVGSGGNVKAYGLKEGGRVGFDLGGLTGPAKSIYDSMMAAGYFTEDEIRNAITNAGYEIPDASQPETTQPNIIGAQLNQGGGSGGMTGLQETFTKDLSGDPRFNYLTPQEQGVKYRFDRSVEPREGLLGFFDSAMNKMKESKFFQPKIRGTLGPRLANQSKLPIPSFASFLSNYTSPFNMKSNRYNPLLEEQLNFAETQEGIVGRDPNSGLLKYGPESVLAGKNVISMFGTNDYEKMLQDYITKMNANKRISATKKAAQLAKAEAELKALQAKTEAARVAQYGKTDYGRGSDGQRSYSGDALGDKDLGFGIGATTGGPVSNRTGRGRQDYSKGGVASMFVEKR